MHELFNRNILELKSLNSLQITKFVLTVLMPLLSLRQFSTIFHVKVSLVVWRKQLCRRQQFLLVWRSFLNNTEKTTQVTSLETSWLKLGVTTFYQRSLHYNLHVCSLTSTLAHVVHSQTFCALLHQQSASLTYSRPGIPFSSKYFSSFLDFNLYSLVLMNDITLLSF